MIKVVNHVEMSTFLGDVHRVQILFVILGTTPLTTYGLRKNSHSDIVKSVVTMDDLFKE